jgi:nicotinamide mononucleotide transporter
MTIDLQNILHSTVNLPFVGLVPFTSLLEWIAAGIGLTSVVGNLRLERWGWIAQAISSIGYLGVFYLQGLFGLAVLQIYFTLVAAWAWRQWAQQSTDNVARVSRLQPRLLGLLVAGWLLATVLLGALLTVFGEASSAYIDAFVTSGSILAQGLMVKHYRNTWQVWLIVNVVSIGLFAQNQLWATALLYLVFSALAVVGLRTWKK